jgi:hypothetical protein
MTPERIAELKRLCDDAKFPHEAEKGGRGAWIKDSSGEYVALACGDTDKSADFHSDLIMAALSALPEAIAEVERLTEERDRLRVALEAIMFPLQKPISGQDNNQYVIDTYRYIAAVALEQKP